jgi:hypothetical protein
MAELSTEDRQRIWRGLMRYWSNLREVIGVLSKNDVQAAVNATDTWIDDNQAAYNLALPQAARDNLTQLQKTLLFCAVALARVGIPVLRKMFGEVD